MVQHDLEVLARGMPYLDPRRLLQQGEEGSEIADGQRIDAGGDVVAADLDEAELGVIGPLAQEFGVQRKKIGACQVRTE